MSPKISGSASQTPAPGTTKSSKEPLPLPSWDSLEGVLFQATEQKILSPQEQVDALLKDIEKTEGYRNDVADSPFFGTSAFWKMKDECVADAKKLGKKAKELLRTALENKSDVVSKEVKEVLLDDAPTTTVTPPAAE